MKRFTLLMLLALVGLAGVWADVPFETTTVSDGEFPYDTKWYTIKIGTAGYVLSDNEDASYISLTTTSTTREAADLWAFEYDSDNDAYYVYNKQAGADKVLAAPTTMSGTTGAESYPILMDKDNIEDGYIALWVFEESDDLGDDINGQYMYELGYEDQKVNNRNNILAFWNAGEDAGSTLNIEFAETTIKVAPSTGTLTNSSGSTTSSWKYLWTSTATEPQLTLNSSYNNMTTDSDYDDCIIAYQGSQVSSQAYVLATTSNYVITTVTYAFCAYGSANTVTVDGTDYTASSSYQTITLEDLSEVSATAFTISGGNSGYGIVLDEFYVTIQASDDVEDGRYEVFIYDGVTNSVVYRIPAIATAYNGDLIAVADYRWCGNDIGYGWIDLHYSISQDNGVTWSDPETLIEGWADTGDGYWGYGDAAIVADCESDTVLLVCCEGDVVYTSGTASHHQGMRRIYSYDNGATWDVDNSADMSDQIYALFDGASSMFICSGKICQSRVTKVGTHYRLYCAVLYKTAINYVLYSDDFGQTWAVLGGTGTAPIPSGGDEPKVEEMPDGSIIISSRIIGGRYYNIFTFTNTETAEGSWGTMATSNSSNNGVSALGNSCNGELMVVPARRLSDGVGVYVALQSVPFGPSGRYNVGIYYKGIESMMEYLDPEDFAADWEGKHQASSLGSAYSTMTLQQDGSIGFLFEESTYGKDYTIVYKNYSLETITDSLYTYDATSSRDSVVLRGLDEYVGDLDSYDYSEYIGPYVGNLTENPLDAIYDAYNAYVSSPSQDLFEELKRDLAGIGFQIEIEEDSLYRISNADHGSGAYYLYETSANKLAVSNTIEESDSAGLWYFVAADDDSYYIVNLSTGRYFPRTSASSGGTLGKMLTSAKYPYSIESTLEGLSVLTCTKAYSSSYPVVILDSSYDIATSTASATGANWYIEPVGTLVTGITRVESESVAADGVYYDLQGRRVTNPQGGIYINSDHKKVYIK